MPEIEPRPREFSARITRGARSRPITARRRRAHAGRRLAVLAVAVAVPAMAQGDLVGNGWTAAAPAGNLGRNGQLGFEIPGESFPGSAFYYLEDEPSLAATRPLPPMAAGIGNAALALPGDTPKVLDPGPAARALGLAGSMTDRARAQYCLTLAIYYEAASEPDAGQRAVAQVVLNRVAHPTYPSTVCGVVFQGSERSTGCQFTFTCDGSLARKPSRMWWDRAARVARNALAGAVYAPVGLATHYHTVQIHPYWADSLDSVGTIGAHRFYKWRGAAGRPGAFYSRYLGAEPVPAPHPRLASAVADAGTDADPLALARSFEAGMASAQGNATPHAVPSYTAEVEARGGDTLYRAQNLPSSGPVTGSASGQIREEYANSGRWLTLP